MCTNCSGTCTCPPAIPTPTPVVIDADNVYYNPDNIYPSMLEGISVGNGYTVKYILEQIVKNLNLEQGKGYSQYNLSCFEDCEIETAQDFAETISEEVCNLKEAVADYNTTLGKYATLENLATVNTPKIKNGNLIGIKEGDNLETILNIIVDKYNSLPQFNPTYYKFELVNTSGTLKNVNYLNGLNQLITVGVSPYNTIEISNVKSILTSSSNTLTFNFKGI